MKLLIYLLRIFGIQTYIPIGIRNRVVRFFYPPEKRFDYSFNVNFFGLRYLGNLNSYIDWSVYFFGSYEKETLDLLIYLSTKVKNTNFLDVGANVGHHSIFASKYYSNVISFEPFPDFYQQILNQIELNGIKNIKAYNIALSDKNDALLYYAPKQDQENKGTGSFVKDYNSGLVASLYLKLVQGDDFLVNNAIGDVGVIKIDVEGFENQVILGLNKTIEANRPVVIFEFSHNIAKLCFNNEYLYSLFNNSYDFYQFLPSKKQFKLQSDFRVTGKDLVAIPNELKSKFPIVLL
jgi:FkbM family methyltransferase